MLCIFLTGTTQRVVPQRSKTMADFVPTTVNRTAVRDLAVPIADVTSFNNLVQAVIDDNPFGCVGYTGADGQPVAAVVRNREHYTAKVNFLDGEGKRVGTVSIQSPTIAAFDTNATAVMANATLAAAMGGEAVRNLPAETYYAQLRCHDPSGDDYYVTFTRKAVRISSYQDEAIRGTVEAWADTVGTLE
jgi:hypothetical protein